MNTGFQTLPSVAEMHGFSFERHECVGNTVLVFSRDNMEVSIRIDLDDDNYPSCVNRTNVRFNGVIHETGSVSYLVDMINHPDFDAGEADSAYRIIGALLASIEDQVNNWEY